MADRLGTPGSVGFTIIVYSYFFLEREREREREGGRERESKKIFPRAENNFFLAPQVPLVSLW